MKIKEGIILSCMIVICCLFVQTSSNQVNANNHNLYLNLLGEVELSVGYKIRLENNRAYVSSNEGVEIIDVSNPTAPAKIGRFEGGSFGYDVCDNILFTTNSNGLIVVNVTNAAAPVILGTSNTGQWTYNTRINNTFAFSIVAGDMDIYNVSDLNNPIRVGQYIDTGRGNDVIINGQTAYYADPDEGLEVINVTDVTNPVKIRTVSNTLGAWDLSITNDVLFLGCHGLGFKALDISNPINPVILRQFNDGGEVYGVCGNETFVFLGDLQEGVEVLNYSSSSSLVEIASYEATPHDIEYKGNYVFLADQDNGFILLELSDTQSNTSGLNLYYWLLPIPIICIKMGLVFQKKKGAHTIN